MDGRARVRLRQVEQVRLERRARTAGGSSNPRGSAPAGLAQDAEPGAGTAEASSPPRPQLVLAVAEEREVVVGEPVEERAPPRRLVGVERRRIRQVRDHLERPLAHRLPVLDRGAHLADHAHEVPLELRAAGRASVWRADLGVDHRLADARPRPAPRRARGPRAAARRRRGAPHDRVDDQVDAEAAPVQLHADRVDQERHVVGDDLDGRVGATASRAPRTRGL